MNPGLPSSYTDTQCFVFSWTSFIFNWARYYLVNGMYYMSAIPIIRKPETGNELYIIPPKQAHLILQSRWLHVSHVPTHLSVLLVCVRMCVSLFRSDDVSLYATCESKLAKCVFWPRGTFVAHQSQLASNRDSQLAPIQWITLPCPTSI